jgi:hypothetical protein
VQVRQAVQTACAVAACRTVDWWGALPLLPNAWSAHPSEVFAKWRGGVGARSLNIALQQALNSSGERTVERFGWTFAPGDKVMQIENDYDKDVYNGDIGYIDNVDPEAAELTANFDGRTVTYGFGELDTLVPPYAATITRARARSIPPSSSK